MKIPEDHATILLIETHDSQEWHPDYILYAKTANRTPEEQYQYDVENTYCPIVSFLIWAALEKRESHITFALQERR